MRLPIPYGALTGADGPITLRQLAGQHAVLLLWVSATCGSCTEVIAQIPAWRDELAPVDVRPVLASVDALGSQLRHSVAAGQGSLTSRQPQVAARRPKHRTMMAYRVGRW